VPASRLFSKEVRANPGKFSANRKRRIQFTTSKLLISSKAFTVKRPELDNSIYYERDGLKKL
jgi:hypothetical protein